MVEKQYNAKLGYWQRRILLLCWGAYGLAYIGRVNLSVAIPFMEATDAFDKASLGLVGSCFFWVYAFGQLINGHLGDRLATRTFVFAGLVGSAVLNILFGFQVGLGFMVLIWALNGFFQSTLWGPLMRTLATWNEPEKRSQTALAVFSTAMVGHAVAWGVLGQLAPHLGWRYLFFIPGIFLLGYAFLWYFLHRTPTELGLDFPHAKEDPGLQKAQGSYTELVQSTSLPRYALVGIPIGFVREGINLWMPMLLREVFAITGRQTLVIATAIAGLNLCGLVVARLLISRRSVSVVLTTLHLTGTILTILLWVSSDRAITIYGCLLVLCSMSMYGATSILTSVIPQQYQMTSSAAGFLDFSIYLGAGLSGFTTGYISQYFGWKAVSLTWILALMLGLVFLGLGRLKDRLATDYQQGIPG